MTFCENLANRCPNEPERANVWSIIIDDVKDKFALRWQSDDALLELPSMENEDKIAAMHILGQSLAEHVSSRFELHSLNWH